MFALRPRGRMSHSDLYRFLLFFFNDTATTEIYTLSLHDALPIYCGELLLELRGEHAHHPSHLSESLQCVAACGLLAGEGRLPAGDAVVAGVTVLVAAHRRHAVLHHHRRDVRAGGGIRRGREAGLVRPHDEGQTTPWARRLQRAGRGSPAPPCGPIGRRSRPCPAGPPRRAGSACRRGALCGAPSSSAGTAGSWSHGAPASRTPACTAPSRGRRRSPRRCSWAGGCRGAGRPPTARADPTTGRAPAPDRPPGTRSSPATRWPPAC